MRSLLKICLMAGVLAATATYASADSISLASGVSPTGYCGYSSVGGAPFNAMPPSGGQISSCTTPPPAATQTILPAGIWAPPITGSTWISFENTGPGNIVVPNGYYTFETTFTAAGGAYTGSLELLADDTVAVFLNGALVVNAGAIGGDGHCSDNPPTCLTVDTLSPWNATLNAGTNQLIFVVEQTGLVSMGLDYDATLQSTAPVPEPSSLLLLGTGLVSSAGALLRRKRAAKKIT